MQSHEAGTEQEAHDVLPAPSSERHACTNAGSRAHDWTPTAGVQVIASCPRLRLMAGPKDVAGSDWALALHQSSFPFMSSCVELAVICGGRQAAMVPSGAVVFVGAALAVMAAAANVLVGGACRSNAPLKLIPMVSSLDVVGRDVCAGDVYSISFSASGNTFFHREYWSLASPLPLEQSQLAVNYRALPLLKFFAYQCPSKMRITNSNSITCLR